MNLAAARRRGLDRLQGCQPARGTTEPPGAGRRGKDCRHAAQQIAPGVAEIVGMLVVAEQRRVDPAECCGIERGGACFSSVTCGSV